MHKLLLTAEEAAEIIGVGRTRMYELLRIGAVRSVRIGACRRIPRDALVAFVDDLREDTSGYDVVTMANRRADGDGSITWDASVPLWVGRLPRNERGRRAKVSAKTKAEVRAKLQQRMSERELGLSTDAGRTTVQQFLEAWIRERSLSRSPREQAQAGR